MWKIGRFFLEETRNFIIRKPLAAYRAAFATPEDARALKELYPGGVNEARTAANRARLLDDIDRAYFGTAGKSPEETSAARTPERVNRAPQPPVRCLAQPFTGSTVCGSRLTRQGSAIGPCPVGSQFPGNPLT
jgi:hypothetical protein